MIKYLSDLLGYYYFNLNDYFYLEYIMGCCGGCGGEGHEEKKEQEQAVEQSTEKKTEETED